MTLYDLKGPDWSASGDIAAAPDRFEKGNNLGRRSAGVGSQSHLPMTATLLLTPDDSNWLHSVLTDWPGCR